MTHVPEPPGAEIVIVPEHPDDDVLTPGAFTVIETPEDVVEVT
jgi:hypothetical protein